MSRIGIPGNVDPSKGTTRYLPNFGWLHEGYSFLSLFYSLLPLNLMDYVCFYKVQIRKLFHEKINAMSCPLTFKPLKFNNK